MDLGSISLWPPSSFIGLSPPWTSPRNLYSGLLSLDLTTRSRTLFTASLRNVHSFEPDHVIVGPSIISLLLHETSPPLHEDSPLLDIHRRLEPTINLQETSSRTWFTSSVFASRPLWQRLSSGLTPTQHLAPCDMAAMRAALLRIVASRPDLSCISSASAFCMVLYTFHLRALTDRSCIARRTRWCCAASALRECPVAYT